MYFAESELLSARCVLYYISHLLLLLQIYPQTLVYLERLEIEIFCVIGTYLTMVKKSADEPNSICIYVMLCYHCPKQIVSLTTNMVEGAMIRQIIEIVETNASLQNTIMNSNTVYTHII